jgi:hypothetical protein
MTKSVQEVAGQTPTSTSQEAKRVQEVLSAANEQIFQTSFAGLDGAQQTKVICNLTENGKNLYSSIRRSGLALGQVLCRLHAVVPHGSWGDTLATMDLPPTSAERYMSDYKKAMSVFPEWLVTLAAQQKVNLGRLNFIQAVEGITIPANEPNATEALKVLDSLVRATRKQPRQSETKPDGPVTYDDLFREAEAFVRQQTGINKPPVTLICDVCDLMIRRLKAQQDPETGTVTFPEAD